MKKLIYAATIAALLPLSANAQTLGRIIKLYSLGNANVYSSGASVQGFRQTFSNTIGVHPATKIKQATNAQIVFTLTGTNQPALLVQCLTMIYQLPRSQSAALASVSPEGYALVVNIDAQGSFRNSEGTYTGVFEVSNINTCYVGLESVI